MTEHRRLKFGPSNVLKMSIYIHIYINSEAISKKLPGVQAPFRSHCASDFRNTAANVARQRQNVRRRFIKMADEKFELAIKRVLEGHTLFISGQCRYGKTFLLRKCQDTNF